MKTNKSSIQKFQKGFTLVELLVVIAIVGILAVGLITVINPADKIKSANDTRVINDIVTIAKGVELYAANNNGVYPAGASKAASCTLMINSGDLKSCPVEPSGYIETYAVTAAGGGNIYAVLRSAKNVAAGPVFKYDVTTSKTCYSVNTAAAIAAACQ